MKPARKIATFVALICCLVQKREKNLLGLSSTIAMASIVWACSRLIGLHQKICYGGPPDPLPLCEGVATPD